jgi:hypothetical protein
MNSLATSRSKREPLITRILCAVLAGAGLVSRGGQIVVAGANLFGQFAAPDNLGDVVAISAGRDHVLALRQDGTVASWGYNADNRSTPPPGLGEVVAIAAGTYHNLALRRNGTVAAWGFNGEGMTNVPAGLGGVVAIAAGGFHSLALARNGTVVGWGYAGGGRTTAPAGLSGVIAIAAGRDHSVALRRDGLVAAWGQNDSGQTDVPAGLTNVVAVACGDAHTLALRSDGTVVAWGANDQRQCEVPAGLTNVTEIAAGLGYSLALAADGAVVSWGNNQAGQGRFPSGGIVAISAGGQQSVALAGGGMTILDQPRSETVMSGGTASFSVNATAPGGVVYQWYFNGQPIAGATNATLQVPAVGVANAGNYQAEITSGSETIWTENAVLLARGGNEFAPPLFGPGRTVLLTLGSSDGASLTSGDLNGAVVQYSTNLLDWADLPDPGVIENGQWRVVDEPGGAPVRFYRLKELP